MSFDAAFVREQGVDFVVVAVKNHVLGNESSRQQAAVTFGASFPGVPIVLMGQDARGRPTFWGRRDLVHFLSEVPVTRLPWRRCNLSA
jgi:hypothetical protein